MSNRKRSILAEIRKRSRQENAPVPDATLAEGDRLRIESVLADSKVTARARIRKLKPIREIPSKKSN